MRRRLARQVMRPRQEIVGLDTEATIAQCLDVDVASGPGGDESQIVIRIEYVLIETQSKQLTQIFVS